MAILRSLKTLIYSKKTLKQFPNTFLNSFSIRYLSIISRSKFFTTSNTTPSSAVGPLFLSSSTPYNLSQSATPLHLQSDALLSFLKRTSLLPLDNQKIKSNDYVHQSHHVAKGVQITDNYVNLPNFISISRLLSGPLLGWMITQEMYSLAFVGLAISGATDWLDGYVARKMGINSVVGSYLDPLADKVLIGCVALSMVENGLLHPGLVALVVMRDVALVGGAVYKRASTLGLEWKSWSDFFNLDGTHPQKVEPLFLSKVNTVFQLILVAAALLQPEFGSEASQAYITYLSWLVALTTISSTVAYGAQHLKSSSITKIHR